jgi:hypothetical protein
VTVGPTPEPGGAQAPRPQDNGLAAPRYVPLTDVEAAMGVHLLTALGKARIAAYLDDSPGANDTRRLFVDSDERADARTIVAAVIRAAGGAPPLVPEEPGPRTDPLAGLDTEAAFADLIADWHVDTVAAIRDAERALTREDADWRARLERPPVEPEPVWLDEAHYVPPPPPPLPRLAAPTVLAVTVLVASILLLVLGSVLALPSNVVFLLGVGGVLVGAGMLFMRIREHGDDDDDGARL